MSEHDEYYEKARHESEIWSELWDYMDYTRDSYLLLNINMNDIDKFFSQFISFDTIQYDFTDEESMDDTDYL